VNALGRMRDGSNHEDPFVIDAAIEYAGQAALERLLVHALDYLWSQTKTPNLCLVGGVALNSLANGKIPSLTHFTNVHVFYAPGDSGTAIGAAIWKRVQGEERNTQKLRFFWSPYLGREYLEGESRAALAASCLVAKRPKNLHRDVAELLVRGRTVGWFQGGSEFGPRALGHRSILADPRRSSMRDHINRRIKGREWFRPLAPVVEASRAAEFFELPAPSPWMQFVCPVRKHARELLPAVTHVDGGARVQTLRAHDNPSLAHLLHEFEPLSGVPVLINTSLNVRGAPIAETPADAIDAFVSSELDALVIDEFLIVKTNTQRD
jgi:carbamoyltransferase